MSLDSVFLTDVKDTTDAATTATATATSNASSTASSNASSSSELSAAGAYCLALLPEVCYLMYLNFYNIFYLM
jgi:hypothetical protein